VNPALPRRRLLRVFDGIALDPPPLWLMRQAGRYLPEYRATRREAGSFLDLCYNPALAAEVTLQPIRRYGFDAAILFSDILVVPDALGQPVRFVEGEGPRLDPVRTAAEIAQLKPGAAGRKYRLVAETVARLRADLPKETALFGFCGAPWTVATYMVAGEGTKDQAPARLFAYRDPEAFQHLLDLLVETSVEYLSLQVEAGADLLQIFDTWAGSLPDGEFERWVVAPTRALVAGVRARHPRVPILGFPRGAGTRTLGYVAATGVDGVSCDQAMPVADMRHMLSGKTVVQGNLDPLLLVAGGPAMDQQIRVVRDTLKVNPFIFNLGHGIVPETPPENVERLVRVLREGH
jgi:uroporphyrinogen decarboxylase